MKTMRDIERKMADLRAQHASAWVNALTRQGDTVRKDEFVDWLRESPQNVREFLIAFSIDRELSQLDPDRQLDVDALLAKMDTRVVPMPSTEIAVSRDQAIRSASSKPWIWATAAALILCIIATWMLTMSPPTGWKTLQTARGEQETYVLEDGSVVHLNEHSRVELHFSTSSRQVRLTDGEAFFQVQHNAQRPFLVYTRNAVIRDLGTRFNVSSRDGDVAVSVIEGSVEVIPRASHFLEPVLHVATTYLSDSGTAMTTNQVLGANEEAQIDRNGSIDVGTIADASTISAWQRRSLVYHRETLSRIIADFNKLGTQSNFRIADDLAGQRLYTGVFDANDPESLAEVLAQDAELAVTRIADTIVISTR